MTGGLQVARSTAPREHLGGTTGHAATVRSFACPSSMSCSDARARATDSAAVTWSSDLTGVGMTQQHDTSTLARRVRRDESGEGVISTAIAVLIMALIGAAMWLLFSEVFGDASDNIRDEVGRIGEP